MEQPETPISLRKWGFLLLREVEMGIPESKLLAYIQLLESTNIQLAFALRKAIELFRILNPPGDPEQWQETINHFERIVNVAERLHQEKPQH